MDQVLEREAASGSVALARLAATARAVGQRPELVEPLPAEARFGPLMRPITEAPHAAAIVAWAVDIADRAAWRPPAPRGIGVALAFAWATRASWGPRTLRRVAVSGVVVAVVAIAIGMYSGLEHARIARIASANAEAAAMAANLRASAPMRIEAARTRWRELVAAEDLASATVAKVEEAKAAADRALEHAALTTGDGVAALARAQAADKAAQGFVDAVDAWARAAQVRAQISTMAWPEAYARTREVVVGRLEESWQAGRAAEVIAAEGAARRWPGILQQLPLRQRPEADAETLAVFDTVASKVDAAVAAANLAAATELLNEERDLAERIAQAYTLRIVDRPGERSGVWRHPPGRPSQRDYYLIVEAIDAAGTVLMLPVLNEETQRTERVSKFGVRVPIETFEAVRDEKQGRGRIEQTQLGRKPSGTLNPVYDRPAFGGFITEW
ncbi:hypothetical protein [Dolichospermum phage Dfl-JY45]